MISKFLIVALLMVPLGTAVADGNGSKGGGGGGGKGDGGDGGDGGKGGKLKVTISFDSLDANSINYMKEQVKPVVDELSSCVEWDFIPCSTSQIVDDVLQCQDGVEECKIDALHACASHFFQDSQPTELAKFYVCMMTGGDQMAQGEKCAQQAGIDWNKLKGCKPCNDAGKLCDNRYKLLNMLHEPNIPGVMFNRKYDCQKEQNAISDLKGTICNELKQSGGQCPACNGCGGGGGGGKGGKGGSPGGSGGGGPGGSGGGSPGGSGGGGPGSSGGGDHGGDKGGSGGGSPGGSCGGDHGGDKGGHGGSGGGDHGGGKGGSGGGGPGGSGGAPPTPTGAGDANGVQPAPPGTPDYTFFNNGQSFSYGGMILPNTAHSLDRR